MSNTKTELVLLDFGEGYVVLRKDSYEHLAKIQSALETAATWKEFETALPSGEFEKLQNWLSNGGEYVYKDQESYRFIETWELPDYLKDYGDEYVIDADKEFSSWDVIGVADGDYPAWIMNIEHDTELVPNYVIEKYGYGVSSMVAGSWYQFPHEKLKSLMIELEKHGIVATVVKP